MRSREGSLPLNMSRKSLFLTQAPPSPDNHLVPPNNIVLAAILIVNKFSCHQSPREIFKRISSIFHFTSFVRPAYDRNFPGGVHSGVVETVIVAGAKISKW